MCGILTYYKKQGLFKEDILKAQKSLNLIRHRGPDGEGIVLINTRTGVYKVIKTDETPNEITDWSLVNNIIDGEFDLLFGHRRLSIIELSSAGHQPMMDDLGNWITFNGEIYNYLEIKEELKLLGAVFKTNSDTEVILKSYQYWGTNCLSKFNGMWSFVIFNNQSKSLFVSNDRFGVKPLYYTEDSDSIIMVSEPKQIFAFPGKLNSYNQNTIHDFLNFGYLDHNLETFYNELNRFPNSSYCEINPSNDSDKLTSTIKNYYTLPNEIANLDFNSAKEKFRYLLQDSVKLRMRSDVPYAFALSGGLDSSAILYSAYNINKEQRINLNIESFSAVFYDLEGDESKFMKIIESDMNLKANYIEPLKMFNMKEFEKHIYHQDSPVQSTSYFAEYCIAKQVSEKGFKVLLVGQGADEIFAGYHHHFYTYIKSLFIHIDLFKLKREMRAYAKLKNMTMQSLRSRLYNDLKQYVRIICKDQSSQNKIITEWRKVKNLDDILKLDFKKATLPVYLKSDDRDGMAFSIESRHPFLDYRLVDFAFTLPDDYKIKDGWQKSIIRESITEMPIEIRYRKDKKGFTTPQDYWLSEYKNELMDYKNYLNNYKNISSDEFREISLGVWLKQNKI